MWRWRKIFSLGGGSRATVTKNGVGVSFQLPGFRVGVSPQGRPFFSLGIKGTGLYYIKYL